MSETGAAELTILIADDSLTVRRFVLQAVQKCTADTRMVEAVDGNACQQQLATGAFDIAFVDVNMPGRSGLEAVAAAREQGARTFVVIMSTEADAEKTLMARDLGAYDYLAKPFTEGDVAGILGNFARFREPSSVLLVDDSASTRSVIKRVMEDSLFNLQIDEAVDGASAIAAYQSGRHDLVFLDINMPGLSGIDTLETLRKINEDVKVTLMTAEQSEELDRSVQSGEIDSLLYKPFFADDIDRALHGFFGLRQPSLG